MSEYQVLFEGTPVDKDFYEQISRLEVEENADLPGAISLTLPVGVKDEELTWLSDAKLRPFANIAVVATAPDAADECIFDGYVLTHKVHLPGGTAGATVEVWGQDATVLMGMTEHVKVWSGMTEADVAAQKAIYDLLHSRFPDHGFLGEENLLKSPGSSGYRWSDRSSS